MSNIPSTAISNALMPVQLAAQESQRARKVQSDKNRHHSEEVEELDDTAVNSVNDQQNKERRREGCRAKGTARRRAGRNRIAAYRIEGRDQPDFIMPHLLRELTSSY